MMKKLALSLATVAAVSALVAGATFAIFNDSTSKSQTFTAGTVTLAKEGETAPTASCPVGPGGLAPGDNGTCTFTVTYTGSLEAWIGMDYSFGGGLAGQLSQVGVTDNDNLPAANVAGKYVVAKTNAGTVTTAVTYNFSINADNSYQGLDGSVDATFYAVQARNNTNGAGTGPNNW